ncbi:hypothetical protein JYU34_021037 [Plutella xylostella]|uniref:Uncharacterized protein n=1 Tax=Plutella xylostella TaxID=51655 RepID=A0ABQ7PSK0_PLUXY|nr:hypothetical protein JYU34_021037 [Plutella xylostella]
MPDKRVRAPYLCTSLYDMFGWSPAVGSRHRGDISTSSRDDIVRWLKKPDDAGLQVKSSIRAAKSSHSTVFWDLDEYTRKRSYHCYFEVPVSGSKMRDIIDIPVPYPRVKVGPEPHDELNGHGGKIKSKIFTNNAISQHGNNPTVINRAKHDDPVVETELNSKYKLMFDKSLNTDHPSKVKHERRKRYRRPSLICPQCQANVECISQTIVQKTKKADSVNDTSAIKSLGDRKKSEYFSQYNCKTPRSVLPFGTDKTLPPEPVKYSRSKRRTPTKLSRVIRIVRACRHHPPCPVAPSCQKLNVIKNKCKVIPPCPHSPRCVNLPVCIPLAEEKKFLEYENSEESSNVVSADYLRPKPTYQFKAECCAFRENEYLNSTLSKESSIVSLQPSQKTVFNKSPVQVMSAFLQRTKSCQYEYIEFNKDFSYRPPDEGIVFVRDVGCQFKSRHKSGSSFVSRVSSSSTCYELKNIKIGSARCYVNKCTSPVALSDSKSCKSSCSDLEKTSHDASQSLTDKSQEPEPEETWSGKLMKETEGPASPDGCGQPAVCAYRVEVNNPAARSRHNLLGKYKRFTLKRRRRSRGFCCSK